MKTMEMYQVGGFKGFKDFFNIFIFKKNMCVSNLKK